MARSIKTNFIYNIIHTVSGLLFPLITFPYASRVIMADGIGQVQFFNSVINYIVLLTSLGIPMYGIREIARVRDNVQELSKTTTEIITLNLLLNVIGYIVVGILCFTMTKIQANIPLFLLLSTSIFLTTIGCNWFYSGIEDFKYITIRGLVVKSICVILLFVFVKTEEDLFYYGAYTVFGYIGNYLLNFIRLHKYIRIKDINFSRFNPFRHLKPALAIFIFNIITSIYLNLDSVMLGILNTTESVGFYAAATKLSHMLVILVTSLGSVMLPRLSNLIKNNQMEEFYRLANKSYRFVLLVGFPICVGLIVLAPSLVRVFSGNSFEPAILTLQIMAPIIIAIGISNLIGLQVLYPLGKIKLVTLSTAVGAILNFILNYTLIPSLAQNGAAIATVSAEISVTLTQFIIAKKYIPVRFLNKYLLLYCFLSLLMGIVCYFAYIYINSDVICIIVVPLLGILLYGGSLLFLKDEFAIEILETTKKRILHHNE